MRPDICAKIFTFPFSQKNNLRILLWKGSCEEVIERSCQGSTKDDVTTCSEAVDLSCVPMIPTSRFCSIFQIRYKLRVTVKIEKVDKFTAEIPITFGTHAIVHPDPEDPAPEGELVKRFFLLFLNSFFTPGAASSFFLREGLLVFF